MGSLKVEFKTSARESVLRLAEFSKQIPFAMSQGINSTAFDVRDHVRARMGEAFTIRSRRVKTAVVAIKGTKRDRPIQAHVGVRDSWMALHATGGWKEGKGNRIAVPSNLIKRTSTGKVRKTQQPRRIRERKTTFVEDARIQRRRGKRARPPAGVLLPRPASQDPPDLARGGPGPRPRGVRVPRAFLEGVRQGRQVREGLAGGSHGRHAQGIGHRQLGGGVGLFDTDPLYRCAEYVRVQAGKRGEMIGIHVQEVFVHANDYTPGPVP